MIPTFMVTPTDIARVYLRRYSSARGSADWTCASGWHETMREIERGRIGLEPWGDSGRKLYRLIEFRRPDGAIVDGAKGDVWPHDDPRWPEACAKSCGYRFTADDEWQLFWDSVYVDVAGVERSLRDHTPGMMWNAEWMGKRWSGADGLCLVVVLPNGHDWMIDSRANNCTLPDDDVHRCWIRHGTPPLLTVDKLAGTADASAPTTCAAGAGSIQSGDYHGFLQGGFLT